jgi:hypothetical protein
MRKGYLVGLFLLGMFATFIVKFPTRLVPASTVRQFAVKSPETTRFLLRFLNVPSLKPSGQIILGVKRNGKLELVIVTQLPQEPFPPPTLTEGYAIVFTPQKQ